MSKSNEVEVPMSPVIPGSNRGLADFRADLLNTITAATEMVDAKELDYAEAMNAAFPDVDWFYIDSKDFAKTETGKRVRTEQKALYEGLRAAPINHKNPSTFYDRLKAKAERKRYPEKVAAREKAEADAAAAASKGEGEGEGKEAGTPSRNRAPLVRNADEIAALVKFNDGLDLTAEPRGEDIKAVQALLKQALAIIFSAKVGN